MLHIEITLVIQDIDDIGEAIDIAVAICPEPLVFGKQVRIEFRYFALVGQVVRVDHGKCLQRVANTSGDYSFLLTIQA